MRFTLSYVGIQVRDLERSLAFYTGLLGMEVAGRENVKETKGEWAVLRTEGSAQRLELNWYPPGSAFFQGPYRNGDELDHIAFRCEDVDSAYRELVARGAKPGLAPFDEGGERLAYVVDPDGIWIELVSDNAAQG
jgi:lactoylglutathione lyase